MTSQIAGDIHKYFGAAEQPAPQPPREPVQPPRESVISAQQADIGRAVHEYFRPEPLPPVTGRSYWEDPRNIAMHYQAQLAAPPGADIGSQYGWDTQAVADAYEYMRTRHNGDPWWMWKPLDESDPYRAILQQMGEPPPEAQYRPGKTYEWQVETPSETAAVGEPQLPGQWPQMGSAEYQALPGWQRFMMSVQSSGALSGVETMLPWAGFTLLTGGVAGLAALPSMLFGGAALGHFTSEQTFGKLKGLGGWREALANVLQPLAQKTFLALNWPTERLEQAVGLLTQLGEHSVQSSAAYAAGITAGALNKVFDLDLNALAMIQTGRSEAEKLLAVLGDLESAWQAGRLTYEATALTPVGRAVGNLPAAMFNAGLLPEVVWDYLRTGDTDVVFNRMAGPGEVWVLGQAEPVRINRAGLAIMDAARQEIAQGADWRDVYNKYFAQLGMSGQLADLVAQSLADPLNVTPLVESRALALFGKATRNPVLVKAARLASQAGEGAIGTRRVYRALLPTELRPFEMSPGQLKLVGINPETGAYESLSPARTVQRTARSIGEAAVTLGESPFNPGAWVGFVRNLFELTPDSRYKAVLEMAHDNAGLLLNMGGDDPKEMFRLVRAWRELDLREAAAAAEILGMPEAATVKPGLSGLDVDALEKVWDMGASARRVLDNLSEALGERRAKVLDMLHDARRGDTRWAETLVQRIKDQAAQRGKAGVLGDDFNARALTEAMAYLDENWWAADASAARAVLHNHILDEVSSYALAAYGVRPGSKAERLTSALKSVQSLLVLGLNPAYKLNNDISNTVGALSEGIFGMASDATIRAFFDGFGVSPYRYRAGIGAADIEVRPETTGRSLTETERVRQAYETGGVSAAEREGIESVEVRLRERKRAGDVLQKVQDVAQRVGRRGPVTTWAARAEQQASARAAYYGIRQAFTRLWTREQMIPGMSPELRSRLDQIDPRLHDTLMTIVERSLNPDAMADAVVRALSGEITRRVVDDHVDAVAADMGIAPADLRDMLESTGVAQEINMRIERGASVDDAFAEAEGRVQQWLDAKLQADLVAKAHDSQARVSSEGYIAAMDLMTDLQFKLEEVWTRHFSMWQRTYEMAAITSSGQARREIIRTRANEARAQWRAYRQWERATWAGVLRELGFGEGKAATHEARLFMRLMKGLHESWGRFFDTAGQKYEAYFERSAQMDAQRRAAEWSKLQQELSDLYVEYAARENRYNNLLGYAFIKMFGEQYGAARAAGAAEWWQAVRILSTERQELMRAFRAWERGDIAGIGREDVLELVRGLDPKKQRHVLWPRFLRELYLPTIGKLIKAGLDAASAMAGVTTAAPETDIVARYEQTLEGLRRGEYRPGQEAGTLPPEVAPVASAWDDADMRKQLQQLGYVNQEIRDIGLEQGRKIIDEQRVSDGRALYESRNAGLMGPRDQLGDPHLPQWFTDAVGGQMAYYAGLFYDWLPASDDAVIIVKTQTNDEPGGEFEGSYRVSQNPMWYREWVQRRKEAGLPPISRKSVESALQRIMENNGRDAIRFGESTIEELKRVILDFARQHNDEYFDLYDQPYIWSAIEKGDFDRAAQIYDAWVTSDEVGQQLSYDDLVLLAGGEENLKLVQDHWARDEWRENLLERFSQEYDEILEMAARQQEASYARPYERDNDAAVDDAIEEIKDQVIGDDWVSGLDEHITEQPEIQEFAPLDLLDETGEPLQLSADDLDALRDDGRMPFETFGEFENLVDMSRPVPVDDWEQMREAGTLDAYLTGQAPLIEERRKNAALRAMVDELQQRLRDATTDPDTGLPVWKHHRDRVEAAPVKLAVDVSGLKFVNDNFGFSSGNALLRAFADVTRDFGYDAYRVGGDEFVLTFDTVVDAEAAAARLQAEFSAVYVPVQRPGEDVQYFRGFSIYTGIGDTFDTAYQQVDQAKAAYKAENPELVRGGRPPTIAEAARLYNMADVQERKRALIDLFRFTEEQADAELVILDQAAEVWSKRTGNAKEMFWYGTGARKGGGGGPLPEGAAEIQATMGGYPRGALEVVDSTSRMIWALDQADVDTWLHESAHLFYVLADNETRMLINQKFGGNTDDFADGYVRWRAYGEAPGGAIRAMFENFRAFVRDVLERVARVMKLPENWLPGRPLDAEMEKVYKRLFELDPWEMSAQRYAIIPDPSGGTPRERLDEHPHLVMDALADGIPVRDDVILEYPGIKQAIAEWIEPGKPVPVDVIAASGDVPREPPTRKPVELRAEEAPPVELREKAKELAKRQIYQPSRDVIKLLAAHGLDITKLEPELYLKIKNPPFLDLVVETHKLPGVREPLGLFLTHYVEENGDWIIDTEMVFEIQNLNKAGESDWQMWQLTPYEYGYRDVIRGGERRLRNISNSETRKAFETFAKNLLDQGFADGEIVDPRAERRAQLARERESAFLDAIVERLRVGGLEADRKAFETMAEEAGFDLRNERELNLIYDLFEGALNILARDLRRDIGDLSLDQRLEYLQRLEERLLKARRTIGKLELQQFSTPLPISEAAMYAADVRPGDTVGEPTAGTGNLVDGFWARDDIAVRVNEIDPGRQSVLRLMGYEPSGIDVLSGQWVVGADGRPLGAWADVMIINPPWGAYSRGIYGKPVDVPVKGMNDWSQRFSHLIWSRLSPGGRMVIVAPTNWVYTKDRKTGKINYRRSEYLKWLDATGYVRAVIEAPAGSYDTRATGVGSLLIVVDKVTPALRQPGIEAFGEKAPHDWRAYAALVEQIGKRGDSDVTRAHSQTAAADRVEPTRPATGPDATGLVDPAARRGESRGNPADIGRLETEREPTSIPDAGAAERGRVSGAGLGAGRIGETGADVIRATGEGGGAAASVVGEERAGVSERISEPARELSPAIAESIERSKATVASSRNFTLYTARAPLRPDDVSNPHPAAVVETKALAGVDYPPLEEAYRPSDSVMGALRRRVISTEGNLDPVWAAIQQNDKHNSALLVADDVGMGKSRTAAAYVLDRIEKGRKRILVITKGKQNVDNLMQVEFPGVWGGRVDDFGAWVEVPGTYIAQRFEISGETMPEVKRGEAPLPLVDGPAVYFIAENNVAAFQKALEDAEFDCIVVDEAHAFRNSDTQKGAAWYSLHKSWLERNANMLYLTATPGADVMDLQYLYGLRLWTPDGFGDWLSIITGDKTAEDVQRKVEAEERVFEYASALEQARSEISIQPETISPKWGYREIQAVRVGDYIIYKDRFLYEIRHSPVPGDIGEYAYGNLRSETEAIIIADIAMKNGGDIYEAVETYRGRFPDVSRTDVYNAGYKDASDIQAKVDKGTFGRGGKRSAWEMTLTPAHTENIMRELKIGGYYVSRDISRAGVEFNVREYLPDDTGKKRLEKRIALYRRIINAFQTFGRENQGPKKMSALFGVNGDIQADVKRTLFDIRLRGAIEEAKAALARGEKVVISVISVSDVEGGGRLLENAISKINTKRVENKGGGKYSDPEEIPEALLAVGELREAAAELGDLASPLDILRMEFGGRIGFVTGKQSAKERASVTRAFQQDQLDVVLISGAGKTGINLHDTTGKRRVHLIVADYEWSATNFKQELGRVDRTGQKTSPIVTVLHTGTASERKFVATITNRMKGLGAVSKGEGESTGTTALSAEFEFGTFVDRLAMANTWAIIGPDYRGWFLDRYFNDPQIDGAKRSSLPTTNEAIQKFLMAFQQMPREIGNEIYDMFEKERLKLTNSDVVELDEAARAQRFMGEILRETELANNLRLTEVRADDGTKYGIVSGVMSPVMNRLRNLIEPNYQQRVIYEGQKAQQWMRWVQFHDAKQNKYVSGIMVRTGRVKAVGEAFGKLMASSYKPETALSDILAGDKIPIHGAGDADWKLYLGSGGYRSGLIVVEGAKLSQRDALMTNGAIYDARGSFFHVEPEKLQEFLKRFPIRDVAPPPDVSYQWAGSARQPALYQWAVPENGTGRVPKPSPDAEQVSRSIRGISVIPLPRPLSIESGGRKWRVVGFVFDEGKFLAYVPERFSSLRSFRVEDKRARLLGFNEKGEWVYTLDDNKVYTRPMENQQQPMAAGPLALGTLDAVGASPTFHSEIQAEGYRNWVLPALDAIQQRMKSEPGVKLSGVDENTMRLVKQWMAQVQQRIPVAKRTAINLGMAKRDAALYNYSRRRNIDTFMGMIYPYHFWMTRNAAMWAIRQLDRPAWASQMARLAQFMRTYEDKDDRPSRMKRKFYIPQAWLPDWAGGGVWVDPMSKLFPHSEMLRPLDYFMQSQTRLVRIATQQLRDWAKAGDITAQEADEAAQAKSGALWERALAMARRNEGSDWTDYMSLFTTPAMYLTLPYKVATGQAGEQQPLPLSRLIQGIATATGADWLKNLDVEATLRDKLGYSKFGQFGDYYVERQLANMAIEGLITPEEATRAMIEKSGDAYAEALKRVEFEQMAKNPGLSAVYSLRQMTMGKAGIGDVLSAMTTTLLPGSIIPQGELQYRGLVNEYNAAFQHFKATGDDSLIDQFYDEHPEYEARRALYRNPQDRIKYYLINEVWDRYAALPELHKKQVREQLGDKFTEGFLSRETRDYDSLSAETLAGWARLLGGAALPGMGEAAETRPLELAEQGPTDAYSAYVAEKQQRFAEIDRVLSAYYAADQRTQDAMRVVNPQIDAYFNWRYQFMADHPELIEYLVSEDSKLAGLKPEVSRWLAQYYADRGRMFPGIFTLQDQYYALKGREASAFKKQHPELEQYWTWRRAFQAQHPEIIPFVNSVEKVAEGVLGKGYGEKYSGIDLSKLPRDIQADLFGYTFYGARLTRGSYSYLRYQWERAGRPMGSFDGWLNALTGR